MRTISTCTVARHGETITPAGGSSCARYSNDSVTVSSSAIGRVEISCSSRTSCSGPVTCVSEGMQRTSARR
ncbi:MAG: hypothetical protein L6W00_05845 [Lentisphaeria bacterium]|nr:MAG: hypothetical protein L6W00_05845 [Lentisphaeria bacterium]